ncbi:hypothetical protein Nepgr_022645 [Nepenthes gracilis]|uniref:TCP domain-containing protein n=1 Tax=Nepenthes gracilis TaxID=150966 RepID=A0AAD3XX75_NEPGR|nr:hypothetical protein Nepgr_022645 [Nepenthes gracilis]
MKVDEIESQARKFSKVGNGKIDSSKIGLKRSGHQQNPAETDAKIRRTNSGGGAAGGGGGGIGVGELDGSSLNHVWGWQHSSRIIRVSRATGGKDRHSKVWTAKGPRDRRVRLSVTTAIQFYDLQDRLGYDQPSKALEWLINAASDSISELPSLNSSFSDAPRQPRDDGRLSICAIEPGLEAAEAELEDDPSFSQNQQHHCSLSKSACSSTSETSKGSGFSLSRSEIRVKAHERARGRAAKEKERDESKIVRNQQQNVNPLSHGSSFTQLLTAGISNVDSSSVSSIPLVHHGGGEAYKTERHWQLSPMPMEYFNWGLISSSPSRANHSSSGFSGQTLLENSIPQTVAVSPFGVARDLYPELQHFPFVPDHKLFVPDHLAPLPSPAAGNDYSLNFAVSPTGVASFNRGTLQSNLPSLFPHLQRFSSLDGSSVPFFFGAAAVSSSSPPVENHHNHHQQHFPADNSVSILGNDTVMLTKKVGYRSTILEQQDAKAQDHQVNAMPI